MIHRPNAFQGYARCDQCMKTSAIVVATNDDAVKEILCAAGWSFAARGQSHCLECATAPPVAASAARKRYR